MDEIAIVRDSLCAAKRAGTPWDQAWHDALQLVPPGEQDSDAYLLRAALSATRDAWRRAYRGEPPTRTDELGAFLSGYLTGESPLAFAA